MNKWLKVANYIIEKKNSENDEISIMELLKLSYIAHGYCLAIKNKPLLDCSIEAWPLGPVAVDMYNAFRWQGIIIEHPQDGVTIEEEYKSIIDAVLDEFKTKTAYELSDLTHMEGSPWTETIRQKGFYAKIDDGLTKKYYSSAQ